MRVSDRFGARAFATGGLLLTALTFVGLILLPADFNYVMFAALLALNGIGIGPDGRAELGRDHERGAGRTSAAPPRASGPPA